MPLSSLDKRIKKITPKDDKSKVNTFAVPTDRSISTLDQRITDINAGESQANKNINVTIDQDPDKAADNYNMSKESGFPLSVVESSPDEVKKMIDSFEFSTPSRTQNYIAKSLQNATISQGDYENLQKAEITFGQKLKQSFQRGLENVELGNLRSQQLFGDVSEATENRAQEIKTFREKGARKTLQELMPSAQEISRQVSEMQKQAAELEPEGLIEKGLLGAAEQAPILGSTFLKALERGLMGASAAAGLTAAVGAFIPAPEELVTVPAAAGIGFGAGLKVGAAEAIFKLEAGLAADEFMDFRDENNQPLDPGIIWAASVGVGLVNSGLEFASLKFLLKTIPGADKLLGRFTTKQVLEILKKPSVRKALARVGAKYAGAVGMESITEGAQEAVTIIGGELAKIASNEADDTIFKGVDLPAAAKRVLGAGQAAIGPTMVFGVPGSIVGVYQAVSNTHDSNDFMANLDKDKKAIDETKTLARSRDHAKDWIKTVGKDEEVYISPEGVDNLFQSQKEDAPKILKKMGVDVEKARESISTGEDTAVSVNEILTLEEAEYNALKDDIKPAPGAYTQREIRDQKSNEDIENSVNLLKEETAKDKAIEAEITRIKEEGKKAGLDKEVTENVPALMTGLANRLSLEGIDKIAFLKKIGIKKTTIEQLKGFFQAEKGVPPRAAIPLTNESHLISLLEGADLSSVLHEVGHIALKEYNNLETTGQASNLLKEDMTTLRNWVGAKQGQEFTREQSEQVARGFETYLMEGKAPTTELRAVFERFKRWLIETYKTAKALNVKLNPQVRQVFDRMLSANLEVEAMAQSGGFTVKTTDEMNALGMIKADQEFAKRLIDDTTKKAERRLTQARNKGYRENVKDWKEQSRREIKRENPVYNTIDAIIKEDKQIDKDEFIDRYGEESIKLLPNRRLIKKNGQSIDMVAAFYGYDNEQIMITEFFKTPKFSEAVNRRVQQKQIQHDAQFKAEDYIVDLPEYRKYLDIIAKYLKDKTVDLEAVEAVAERKARFETEAANEIKAESPELTGEELESAINARIKEKSAEFRAERRKVFAISNVALKRLAKETMAAKTVKEARRVDKFLSAMKKASSDERRAILRKDWGAASTANELSRFNYEMAGLSVKIRNEVDTILKRAKRIGKAKNVALEYREAALHLISRYNLASLLPQDPKAIPDYNKLFKGDFVNKEDKIIDDEYEVPSFLFSNTVKDFRGLSMEQLRDLDNAIRYLEGQGNLKRKETLSDQETLLQGVVDESVEKQNTVKPQTVWEKRSMMRKLTGTTRKFFAMFDSLTFEMKSLDGYTNLGKDGVMGPAERWVTEKIKDAGDKYIRANKQIREQLKPHLLQISRTIRKWHKEKGNNIRIKGAPLPDLMREDGQTKGWYAQQIFALVLNTGNQGETSNYENLLAGYPDLTPGMIETIKDMLSQEDMDAIQGIWDVINTLFEETDTQYLRTKNYRMPKVEATPFTFKGKEYRGGYYPIKHDRALSYKVDDRGKVEDVMNDLDTPIAAPYTKSGHSVKRVRGVALPILLDLGVIDSHFMDALHYIHFTDVVRDADRITRHHDFRKAATRILGKDVYNTIRPALKHIANPKKVGLDISGSMNNLIPRAIEKMRGLSTLYVLAWNTGVAIKQPLSTFGAIKDMGFKAYVSGFSSVLMSPSVHYQKMTELSAYMQDRLKSFDRELKSAFLKLTKEQRGIYFGDTKVTWQDVKNFGFWQIRLADTATVLPIWHGAFQDKLLPDQSNLQEAIRYADNIVRDSQPSAQPLDLSSWQRDGGVIRLFSQFQTFTVGKYGQRQRLHYRAWRNKSISTVDYAWFNFMDAFVPLMAINMLQALIWGRDVEDKETMLDILYEVTTSWLFMGVPFARNIFRAAFGYGDPIDSPVLQAGNKVIQGGFKGLKSLKGFDNKREREAALWGIGHAISILSGVPVSKVVSRAVRGAEAEEAAPGIKYLIPPPRGK